MKLSILKLTTAITCLMSALPMSASADLTVDGMAPDAYYMQLVTKTVGSCVDTSKLMFTEIYASQISLGKNEKGQDLKGYLSVYLNSDHTFTAKYEEATVLSYDEEGFAWETAQDKTFTGSWSVSGIAIDLKGVGSGVPLMYNGRAAVNFTFAQDIFAAGLKDQGVILDQAVSNVGERTIGQYCPLASDEGRP